MFNVGVVGSTGLVGETFVRLLEERDFPVSELRLFASQHSIDKKILFRNASLPVQQLTEDGFKDLDIVFFSSGDEISEVWAPKAVTAGAFAIDNSAAFRQHPGTPLVVPEINGALLKKLDPCVIANPNCSTIQLVLPLNALRGLGLQRVWVATYQAVSGAGKGAQEELCIQNFNFANSLNPKMPAAANSQGPLTSQIFPHPIAYNCLPQIGSFETNGFCSEELKIMKESRKILDMPELNISAFTVRVPAWNAHSEAVWVDLSENVHRSDIENLLIRQDGIEFVSQKNASDYPHAQSSHNRDSVFIGRLHQDLYNPKTWIFWVVADNLRKGAALNGIQIAETLIPRIRLSR